MCLILLEMYFVAQLIGERYLVEHLDSLLSPDTSHLIALHQSPRNPQQFRLGAFEIPQSAQARKLYIEILELNGPIIE